MQSAEYSAMNWIAVLMENRHIEPSRYDADNIMETISRKYLVDLDLYDVIKGYRADDSYFHIAEMFVDGLITYQQLKTALKLGDFGEQIVLKSKKAFDAIHFVSSEQLEPSNYHKAFRNRESKAVEKFNEMVKVKKNTEDVLTINEILEMNADDPRLF